MAVLPAGALRAGPLPDGVVCMSTLDLFDAELGAVHVNS